VEPGLVCLLLSRRRPPPLLLPRRCYGATAAVPVGGAPRSRLTDQEIRFGIAAPFSGSAKELGADEARIDAAFNRVNETAAWKAGCSS